MSKTPEPQEEILCIEECAQHIRREYAKLYPRNKKTNHTFGNIPDNLHKEILTFADTHNLRVAQAIATLWDFFCEYEGDFAEELAIQRSAPNRRRKK